MKCRGLPWPCLNMPIVGPGVLSPKQFVSWYTGGREYWGRCWFSNKTLDAPLFGVFKGDGEVFPRGSLIENCLTTHGCSFFWSLEKEGEKARQYPKSPINEIIELGERGLMMQANPGKNRRIFLGWERKPPWRIKHPGYPGTPTPTPMISWEKPRHHLFQVFSTPGGKTFASPPWRKIRCIWWEMAGGKEGDWCVVWKFFLGASSSEVDWGFETPVFLRPFIEVEGKKGGVWSKTKDTVLRFFRQREGGPGPKKYFPRMGWVGPGT